MGREGVEVEVKKEDVGEQNQKIRAVKRLVGKHRINSNSAGALFAPAALPDPCHNLREFTGRHGHAPTKSHNPEPGSLQHLSSCRTPPALLQANHPQVPLTSTGSRGVTQSREMYCSALAKETSIITNPIREGGYYMTRAKLQGVEYTVP